MSHQTISFIKSAIRICGYIVLPIWVDLAAVLLIASEVLGIYEEVGH